MAEMGDFESRLKSMTGGDGSYSIAFSHFDRVPESVQQRLTQEHQQRRAAGHHGAATKE
jgi:elongation factor G